MSSDHPGHADLVRLRGSHNGASGRQALGRERGHPLCPCAKLLRGSTGVGETGVHEQRGTRPELGIGQSFCDRFYRFVESIVADECHDKDKTPNFPRDCHLSSPRPSVGLDWCFGVRLDYTLRIILYQEFVRFFQLGLERFVRAVVAAHDCLHLLVVNPDNERCASLSSEMSCPFSGHRVPVFSIGTVCFKASIVVLTYAL